MRPNDAARWASLLVPALFALAASTVLLVDYTRPVPIFCAQGGGCEAVKRTAFAHVGGIPTPAFGVAAFVILGVLTGLRGAQVRFAQACLATFAAVVSVALLGVQFRIHQFCPYCVVSDVAAVLLFGAAVVRYRSEWDPPPGRGASMATAGLLSASMVVPGALSLVVKPAVPPAIRAELAKTPPGMATVVDFVDFECPWCRRNHKELAPLLKRHAGRVRVARKQVPLPMHLNAINAARASVCADKLGKGDEVADALFATPPSDLDPRGCEDLAKAAGVDLEAYRACVKDPATDARILADSEEFKVAGGHGLPTLWIGVERIEGANDAPVLSGALERALAP